MRILFVANQLPCPPNNGVRIVLYNAMRLMRDAGHEIRLSVLSDGIAEEDLAASAASGCCDEGSLACFPTDGRQSLSLLFRAASGSGLVFMERFKSDAFRRHVSDQIESFRPDVVHFDLIPMTQYMSIVPAGIGTVASINDSWAFALENALSGSRYTGLERVYRKLELARVREYERLAYARFDAVHVMSARDKRYLHDLNPAINAVVIPNGVHRSLFECARTSEGSRNLLFVGHLVEDNLHSLCLFLELAWPTVLADTPDAQLFVAGRWGAEARRRLAAYERSRSIRFLGYVDRLEPVFANCGIAIVPIDKDCGLINKALEAMAAGLATVGLKRTFAGIPQAIEGTHFLAANDIPGMAQAVTELLRDSARLRSMQRHANTLATRSFSWETRRESYEHMYESASVSGKRRRRRQPDGIPAQVSA